MPTGAVGTGNVISVVVTAEDGETTQTYTVTVTRAGSCGGESECAFAERGDVDAGVSRRGRRRTRHR